MVQGRNPGFLRLVHSTNAPERKVLIPGQVEGMQGSFLPSDDPRTLIFLEWDQSSIESLLDVFALSKPKIIFDLRVVPRFDIEALTRKRFFEMLTQADCLYVDVCGRMGVSNPSEALTNPNLVGEFIGGFISTLPIPNIGPFVFLHDDGSVDDQYVTSLVRSLPVAKSLGWQIFRPESSERRLSESTNQLYVAENDVANPLPLTRRLVFISHATPEDNAFVTWLTSKLISAGYQVWSDITDLNGGDIFWANIEDAIRLHSAKVIFVQSQFAKGKKNTRKEIYLALKVGERNRLQRFVVPIRIDNTPFDETIIELIDVQAIDCRGNWLTGLRGMLALLERDGVPRNVNIKSDQFSNLVAAVNEPALKIINAPERLISNWLSVTKPPVGINFFSCHGVSADELPALAAKLKVPAFSYYKLLATTATHEKLSEAVSFAGYENVVFSSRASITWDEFLTAKHGDLPSWTIGEARYKAYGLLNSAWTLFMERAGVRPAMLANQRLFWFLEDQRLLNNEIRFANFSGKSVRRQLVGYSKKRKVFWHFGAQARTGQTTDGFYFCLTPHVTFSADGRTVLPSKAQLHSLRRSFCRSWWNNRWRDLLNGYVAFFAAGDRVLKLDVGAVSLMEVSADFQFFDSPVLPSTFEAEIKAEESAVDYDPIEDPPDDEFEEEFEEEIINDLSDVNSPEQ